MIDFNSDEDIRRILKSAYEPAVPSPGFREQLLEYLTHEVVGTHHPIWRRTKLWVPIAVTVISAVIGYGVWLSLGVVSTLSP